MEVLKEDLELWPILGGDWESPYAGSKDLSYTFEGSNYGIAQNLNDEIAVRGYSLHLNLKRF